MWEQVIEYVEMAEETAMAELGAFGCIEQEREPRPYWNEELAAMLDFMDDEMEAEGVEDALEWERFDEYEDYLYLLAERMVA